MTHTHTWERILTPANSWITNNLRCCHFTVLSVAEMIKYDQGLRHHDTLIITITISSKHTRQILFQLHSIAVPIDFAKRANDRFLCLAQAKGKMWTMYCWGYEIRINNHRAIRSCLHSLTQFLIHMQKYALLAKKYAFTLNIFVRGKRLV